MEQDTNTVAPANVAPAEEKRKKSGGNGWKVATIVAAVAAICGVGFGAYGMIQNSQSEAKTNLNKCDDDENSNVITVDDTIAENEVKELVDQIDTILSDYMENPNLFSKTYNEFIPDWKMDGTDIFVDMEKSYGIVSDPYSEVAGIASKMQTIYQPVEAYLEKNGYVREKGASHLAVYYHNKEKDIICEFSEGTLPWSMGCAKTFWYSDETAELVTELSEASGSKYIGLRDVKIIDSSVAPYQRMTVRGEAPLFFYRKSPNDKWEFLIGTQAAISCDTFNDDAKKAYAGEKCYDTKTETLKVL